MGYETILFNKQEYIATVNLNRPNRLNAGNEQVVERHNPLWPFKSGYDKGRSNWFACSTKSAIVVLRKVAN